MSSYTPIIKESTYTPIRQTQPKTSSSSSSLIEEMKTGKSVQKTDTSTLISQMKTPKTPTTPQSFYQAERASVTPDVQKLKYQASVPTGYERFTAPATSGLSSALKSGVAQTDIGVLNTARKALEVVPTLGAKLESAVTGKNVTPYVDPLQKGLTSTIESFEKTAEPWQQEVQNTTGPMKYALGAVQSIPQIAPAFVGATSPQLLGSIGVSAFGSGARDAEKQGASLGKQLLSGGASAGVELATEALPISNLTKLIGSNQGGKEIAKIIGANVLEEFIGESTSEALQPLIEQGYNDSAIKDTYIDDFWGTMNRVKDAGLTGATAAILLGGLSINIPSANTAINNPTPENIEQVRQDVKAQTNVDLGLQQAMQESQLPNAPQEFMNRLDMQQKAPTSPIEPLQQQTQANIPTTGRTVDNQAIQTQAELMLQELKDSQRGGKKGVTYEGETFGVSQNRVTNELFEGILDGTNTPLKNKSKYEHIEAAINRIIQGKTDSKLSAFIKEEIQTQLESGYKTIEGYEIPPITEPTEADYDALASYAETLPVDQADKLIKDVMSGKVTFDEALKTEPVSVMNEAIVGPQIKQESLVQRDGVRKTLPSLKSSPMISDVAKETINDEDFNYEQVTNQETVYKARENMGAIEDFLSLESFRDEVDVARGIEFMRETSNKGDFKAFNRIALKQAELLTKAGREVQAASILRRMTPEGYLQYITREASKLNESGKQKQGIEDINDLQNAIDNATPEQIEKVKKILDKRKIKHTELSQENLQDYIEQIKEQSGIVELTEEENRFIFDKITEALTLEGRAKDVAFAEAYKVFEDKIPASNTDKFAALQRISMLLNVKTQSRNVVGNVLMQAAEIGKEALAIPIDIAASKVTGERTMTPYNKADLTKGMEGLKKGLYEAYDDYIKGINTRRDSGQFEQRARKTFPDNTKYKALNKVSKALNKANELTSFLLSAGDRPFFESTYAMEKSRLERLETYKGKTADIERIALETAEERTFQNRSWLAETAVKTRTSWGLFGRVVLPYAYTPANITDKVFDYSPIGSIRTIKKNLVQDIKRGEFDQRQFAERASRNLTGTALMWIGFQLAQAGIIAGAYSDDKDEKAFQQSIGMQDYAFNAGDKQINFDWAQPIAVPFAAGANLYQAGLSDSEAKESIFNKVAQASLESAKTITEQPLLSGVQELFGGYGSDGILTNAANILKTSPLQVVPGLALLRQTRQTIDPTIRNVDYNSLLEQLRNQMPALSNTLPAKYSTLGEEQQYTGGAMQKFISPATISKIDPSPLEQEILDVFSATGEKDVFPKKAPTSFTVDSVKHTLSKREQSDFQQIEGTYVKDYLEKLMSTGSYKNMSNESKAKIISGIIGDSYDFAKGEFLESNK